MSWLNEVLLQHKDYETPKNFWYWSALASISAVVKDQVHLNRGKLYKLYPNIYVMLHADSGLKKGPAISMANQLVTKVNNTHIIAGRFSIQGLLKKLGTVHSVPGGSVQSISSAFICSSEITSALVEDPVATRILTDLYDRNYNTSEWESLLKMETFKISKPIISMLGATNEAHNKGFFLEKDVKGGYFARTFVVHESKRQNVNSLMFDPEIIPDYPGLSVYLKELAKLRGEIHISHDLRVQFDKWYRGFTKTIDEMEVKDDTGTLNRFDDSVLKVAILLSLAIEPKLEISPDAIDQALTICEQLVGNVRRTNMGGGGDINTHLKKTLMLELIDRPQHAITRQQFNAKYWTLANSQLWEEIAQSLSDSGYIKVEAHGNSMMYIMPEDKVQAWMEHFRGKN